MPRFVEILPNKTALIDRTLELVVTKMREAIEERGQCSIALSGGSTPKPLYEALSNQSLPWENVHFFLGDERYVPPNHPDSNQLMIRQAWLDKLALPETNIHFMPTTAGDAQQDIELHRKQLKSFFQLKDGEFPVFDLILLGMGDDGHTASLFPHTPALKIRDRLVTIGNKNGQTRLTITVPLIDNARCVMLLVSGASKRQTVETVFTRSVDKNEYPVRLIEPKGELWWLLDKEAGASIEDRVGSIK
jgi:6-phosphogluconolactonase